MDENGSDWIGLLANMAQKNMGQPENLAVDALVGGTVSSPVGLLGPHFSESICLEVAQQDTHTHTHN